MRKGSTALREFLLRRSGWREAGWRAGGLRGFLSIFGLGMGLLCLWQIVQIFQVFQIFVAIAQPPLNYSILAFFSITGGSFIWWRWETQVKQWRGFRREISQLQAQITHEVNHATELQAAIAALKHQLEAAQRNDVKQRHQQANLKQQIQERNDLIESVVNQNREYELENNYLQQQQQSLSHQIAQLQTENHQLKQEHQSLKNKPYSARKSLLNEVLTVLLPEVEFLRDSIAVLQTVNQPAKFVKQFKAISQGNVKGERIEGTQTWLELKSVDPDWRIYFRKCKQTTKYQIYLSPKKSQSKDLKWVKQQPSC